MKVLIVSTSDLNGGAAKAAYRLHHALLEKNIDSYMYVQNKSSDEHLIEGPLTKWAKAINKFRFIIDRNIVKMYKNRSKTYFSSPYIPGYSLKQKIAEVKPDIVHLHWIAGGLMNIKELRCIKVPIILSLHDMWAFTGGCHYSDECEAYKTICGQCKVLGSTYKNDLSYFNFRRKKQVYSSLDKISVVGSSIWISTEAKASSLLGNRKIFTIPNPIDTGLFKPLNKIMVKELLNIPLNKKIVFFGAINPLGDPRKGFTPLYEALKLLERNDIELVLAGSSEPKDPLVFSHPVHYIKPLRDDVALAVLYNIADVIIVPSLQENLANSIVEGLSCGVPVVAFNIGGNKDMIEHKSNGYLVKAYDIKDMADGIEYILDSSDYKELSSNARSRAVRTYDNKVVSDKYIDLYNQTKDEL